LYVRDDKRRIKIVVLNEGMRVAVPFEGLNRRRGKLSGVEES
jgi:hypothetical protein